MRNICQISIVSKSNRPGLCLDFILKLTLVINANGRIPACRNLKKPFYGMVQILPVPFISCAALGKLLTYVSFFICKIPNLLPRVVSGKVCSTVPGT